VTGKFSEITAVCPNIYRVIKKSLSTWLLYFNHQLHRDFLITLYFSSKEKLFFIRVFLLFPSFSSYINPLTPNGDYSGRTAPLTSKRCILYIYSTHIGTEYFKHGIYFPFFPLQNAVRFINVTYLVPVLLTFYIQSVLKLKKNNPGAKRLSWYYRVSLSLEAPNYCL